MSFALEFLNTFSLNFSADIFKQITLKAIKHGIYIIFWGKIDIIPSNSPFPLKADEINEKVYPNVNPLIKSRININGNPKKVIPKIIIGINDILNF